MVFPFELKKKVLVRKQELKFELEEEVLKI